MRVADVIADRLFEHGIRHVFLVTGGGAMHLNDAFGKHPGLRCVFFHHEQGCAIAAEGYVRATGRPVAVNVTTGPGGTNALTGLLGQWTDSVPVVYVSGQVKFETTVRSCPDIPLRQLGDQEVDILAVVRPLTKFAEVLVDPADAQGMVDRAFRAATTGRPGPVWIDVPMNVQGAPVFLPSAQATREDPIDPAALPASDLGAVAEPTFDGDEALRGVEQVVRALESARRPVLVAGHGIRLAGARALLQAVAEALDMPVLTTFNGFDLVPDDDGRWIGRIGTIGTRAGNFALQAADLVLFVGTRNNIRQVGYAWTETARHAVKVVVDIDRAELDKPTLRPDIAIHADAGVFLQALRDRLSAATLPREAWAPWLAWCQERRRRHPVLRDHAAVPAGRINPYHFVDALTRLLGTGDTVVSANGTASIALFQAGVVRGEARMICNSGCASMGYDLPASIGAAIGTGGRVVCLAGDGSLMMNLQELATLAHNRLPVKIFLLDNGGYASIRQSQKNHYGLPYVGCGPESGVGFPDFARLAQGFGLPSSLIADPDGVPGGIRDVLDAPGPHLCVVRIDPDCPFAPKVSSERLPDGRMVSKPLDDMWPFQGPAERDTDRLAPNGDPA
jgi:acetolactate synthase-1/2/3 large subunit